LLQCEFDCNYLIGIYNDSVDNNGFALDPVTYSGTPNFLRGVKLTLDHAGSHSANIFSVIGPYCTDVESVNYLTADTWHQGNGYIDKQLRSTPIVAVPQLGMTGVVTAGFVMGTGYPAGWQCWVYNDSAAPIVITAGAGLTLRLSGDLHARRPGGVAGGRQLDREPVLAGGVVQQRGQVLDRYRSGFASAPAAIWLLGFEQPGDAGCKHVLQRTLKIRLEPISRFASGQSRQGGHNS